ncbi:MAG: hypothetical protein ABR887_04400 [Methanoregulaceae archaeon]|jgi:hypothetical protein
MDYFTPFWCKLSWTPWVPFSATSQEFKLIPREPGLYRVRPAGKDFLMYIGETRRSLRDRLNELRHTLIRQDLMPWNDPHTAAPSLWAWHDAEGFSYECSAACLDAPQNERRGWESYLLAQYRRQYGESTLCNFGRFHKRYRKSTNRKEGRRGGKLAENHLDNPAGGPSIPPLSVTGKPGDPNWMGFTWSGRKSLNIENTGSVPTRAGLYFLVDGDSQEIVYIGQSTNCSNRLQEHSRKSWDEKHLHFSYYLVEKPVLAHNLKELEIDLIGNYFEVYKKGPEFQFSSK